jgi:hypothetical protein
MKRKLFNENSSKKMAKAAARRRRRNVAVTAKYERQASEINMKAGNGENIGMRLQQPEKHRAQRKLLPLSAAARRKARNIRKTWRHLKGGVGGGRIEMASGVGGGGMLSRVVRANAACWHRGVIGSGGNRRKWRQAWRSSRKTVARRKASGKT